jgi:hypothetical protein
MSNSPRSQTFSGSRPRSRRSEKLTDPEEEYGHPPPLDQFDCVTSQWNSATGACTWPYHGLARRAVVSFVLPGRVGLTDRDAI